MSLVFAPSDSELLDTDGDGYTAILTAAAGTITVTLGDMTGVRVLEVEAEFLVDTTAGHTFIDAYVAPDGAGARCSTMSDQRLTDGATFAAATPILFSRGTSPGNYLGGFSATNPGLRSCVCDFKYRGFGRANMNFKNEWTATMDFGTGEEARMQGTSSGNYLRLTGTGMSTLVFTASGGAGLFAVGSNIRVFKRK